MLFVLISQKNLLNHLHLEQTLLMFARTFIRKAKSLNARNVNTVTKNQPVISVMTQEINIPKVLKFNQMISVLTVKIKIRRQ